MCHATIPSVEDGMGADGVRLSSAHPGPDDSKAEAIAFEALEATEQALLGKVNTSGGIGAKDAQRDHGECQCELHGWRRGGEGEREQEGEEETKSMNKLNQTKDLL